MLEAMQHDKKVVAGRLHFVLPTAIGATAIVDDVTEKEMQDGAEARSGFGAVIGLAGSRTRCRVPCSFAISVL